MSTEIKVIFYSGYKGEETPRALILGGGEIPIDRVLSRKRCRAEDTGEVFEIFRCQAAGKTYTIRKDQSGKCEVK